MKYRMMGKTGVEVSALGYGCMRFPKKRGLIDEKRSIAQIRSALDAGVNYFDTAYAYPGSEAVLGAALAGRRDEALIADKIPPYLVFSRKDADRILETMLKRLSTDRIDFLLTHALADFDSWRRLVSLGYLDFLAEAKRAGKIRFIGFSWHGKLAEFKKTVDDYPWDFCQIQYNYLDERFQAGTEGLEYAAAKGIGVAVMEPLRGGSLVGRMPRQVKAIMEEAESKRSPAAWALDWVWNRPEVAVILSGLNDETHIAENLALASASAPGTFGAPELATIEKVRDEYRALLKVGCTGCAYCMPCPFGVDIPNVFAMRNNLHLFDEKAVRFQYTMFTAGIGGGSPSGASACTRCGACEKKCPQGLPIRDLLADSDDDLLIPALKPAIALLKFASRARKPKKARA
jgi:predicted aldo/keto reductase-like oxidoreductase